MYRSHAETNTDWVVWARTSPPNQEARLHGEFKTCGRVLAGQEAKGKATTGAGEEMTQGESGGNSCRWKGWWKRGDVKAKASPWPMSCWVHATAGDERCRQLIEEAMPSEAKKDECKVAMSGEGRDF